MASGSLNPDQREGAIMSPETGFAVLAAAVVLYGAVALRLGRWSISMPLLFVAIGYLLGSGGIGILNIKPTAEAVRSLAELTLAPLLFADASTLNLRQVR